MSKYSRISTPEELDQAIAAIHVEIKAQEKAVSAKLNGVKEVYSFAGFVNGAVKKSGEILAYADLMVDSFKALRSRRRTKAETDPIDPELVEEPVSETELEEEIPTSE